jgi:hypothetical protein
MMGADSDLEVGDDATMEPSVDDAMPGEGGDASDDFATDAAAAGGEEAAGRPTRESVEYSRRLGQLLAPKKK